MKDNLCDPIPLNTIFFLQNIIAGLKEQKENINRTIDDGESFRATTWIKQRTNGPVNAYLTIGQVKPTKVDCLTFLQNLPFLSPW